MSKQQTAVEMLVEHLERTIGKSIITVMQGSINHAIQMEREQIENAYWDGGQDVPINPDRCKQYFNDTYGTNKLNKKQNERIIGNNNTF